MAGDSRLKIFPKGQPLWIMTDQISVREDISDGLNRELLTIHRFDDLIEKMTNLVDSAKLRNEEPEASLIYVEKPGDEIERDFQAVKAAVEVAIENGIIFGYEIGTAVQEGTSLFKGAKRYPNIKTFLDSVREERMDEEVALFESEKNEYSDEAAAKITQLLTNYSQIKLRNKNLEEREIEREQSELKLKEEKESLEFKIKDSLEPKVSELEAAIKELEDFNSDLKNQSDTYNKLYEEKQEKVTSLEKDVSSKSIRIEALEDEINELEKKLDDAQDDLTRAKEDRDKVEADLQEILESRVADEEYQKLIKDRKDLKGQIVALQEELHEAAVEKSKIQIRYERAESKLNSFVSDTNLIKQKGYTARVDTGILQRTDLIYFKVIDELGFHRKAIKKLYDSLERVVAQLGIGQKGYLVILRNTEGEEDVHFNDLEIFSYMKDITESHKVSRLMPNDNMWLELDKFEDRKPAFVLVVDYLRTNEYYLDSLSQALFFNIVERSSDIKKLKLKGKPISYDPDSYFNIWPDEKMLVAGKAVEYKEALLVQKLTPLLKYIVKSLYHLED